MHCIKGMVAKIPQRLVMVQLMVVIVTLIGPIQFAGIRSFENQAGDGIDC